MAAATPNLRIDGDRLWDSIMRTASIGGTAKGGINRLTLTDPDRQVRDWFAAACDALLPNYAFSLNRDQPDNSPAASVPIIPVRRGLPDYAGPALSWPPGWNRLWLNGALRPRSTGSLVQS